MVPFLDDLLATLSSHLGSHALQGVWIFGSQATGQARSGSDLDLAVLCDPALELERAAIGERLARLFGTEVDLVDLASCDPVLAWEVITTGRLVQERDERAVERFVREARFRAEDADQRNRMILLAAGGAR
jgi:predicted nucleotidyltransferase